MLNGQLLNARQLAAKMGVSSGTFYKMVKLTNNKGQPFPYHQLAAHSRRYYVLKEVQHWIVQ